MMLVDFWGLDVALELLWLRSYLDVLERHLDDLPGNPPDEVRVALSDPDQDVRDPTQQEWSMLSEEAAPRLARGSYVVALYAAYESGVTQLAADVRTRVGARLGLEDIQAPTFIGKARKYFDKVLLIPLCPDEGSWSTIGELALLRHMFAHANGRVLNLNSQGKRIFEAMIQRGDARESWGAILIEPAYLRRVLEVVDASMRDLIRRTKPPQSRSRLKRPAAEE